MSRDTGSQTSSAWSGWGEAFAYVWVIAVLNLTDVAGQRLGVHPAAFILEAMLVGGFALIAIAGPGHQARMIMLAPRNRAAWP